MKASSITFSMPSRFKNQPMAVILLNVMIIGFALFMIYKYHKKEGFWSGAIAIFLLATFMTVSDNPETKKA